MLVDTMKSSTDITEDKRNVQKSGSIVLGRPAGKNSMPKRKKKQKTDEKSLMRVSSLQLMPKYNSNVQNKQLDQMKLAQVVTDGET